MQDNPIDDLRVNRIFPNKKIWDLYGGKFPPRHINPNFFRNTCLHNNSLDVDESSKGVIGRGSYGVTRKATYRSRDNTIRNGLIKIIELSNYRPDDILELKYMIELNKLIPDHVVGIELIERCDLLKFARGDNIINEKQILLIGMEKGISDLDNYLKTQLKVVGDDSEFIRLISESMDACDMMNRVGYFHSDIKPENIIVNNRNGIIKPLIIDLGFSMYIPPKFENPPFDAVLLGIFILKFIKDWKVFDRENVIKQILILVKKYQIISSRLGVSTIEFSNFATRYLNGYKLGDIYSRLDSLYKKYGIKDRELTDYEYRKYIYERVDRSAVRDRINIDHLNKQTQSREILRLFKEELRRLPPIAPVGSPLIPPPVTRRPRPQPVGRPAAGACFTVCNCIVQSSKLRCKNKSKTVDGFCLVHKNCTTIFRGPASPPRPSPPRLSPPRRTSSLRPSPPHLSPPRRPSPPLRRSSPRLSSPPPVARSPRLDLKNCFPIKTRKGNDLSLEEAKAIARANNISNKGNKREICDRLRNNRPPLCL